MRAIGYRRVSTEQQGESGAGLDAQEALIEAEATRRGWDLSFRTDVGSGKTLKRPELAAALLDLAAGHADVLVVAKLDRLSRSMLDFAGLMATARGEGWSIVALDLGVDTSTPNGKLVASIIMALAEWERELIGQRTTTALSAVKARGVKLGRASKVSDETMSMIRQLHAGGLGYRQIARTLNQANIPTAQGGKAWYPATVRELVLRVGTRADWAAQSPKES